MTTPVLSIPAFVLAVASVHGFVLGGALLWSDRGPTWSRRFLASLVLVLAVLLGDMALRFSSAAWPGPPTHALVNTLWLLVAPLFYGYVRGLLPGRAGWEPEDGVHAVPVLLQLFAMGAFAWAPGFDRALVEAGRPAVSFVFIGLYAFQSAAYALATVGLVRSYTDRYRREAAGADADRLAGLRRLTLVLGAYAVVTAVNVGVLLAIGRFVGWLDYLVPLALAAVVAVVGYQLLRRPGSVFPDLELPPETAGVRRRELPPSPELLGHVGALRELMETERPYLRSEIRLADLARQLGISGRTLSHVLADGMGGSFYEVVNGYRVSEAKRRLADPRFGHFTVLAVGLDSGFSSKASFNRVFKERTGETPSGYRRRAAETPGPPSIGEDGVVVDLRPETVERRKTL